MQPAKTVAAIHDLSGMGRCALTVVIPVISAMGLQVCPVPTAVLSAHTVFEGIAVRDLTDFMRSYLAHWRTLNIGFDAVYTGYLASPLQVEIVREFLAAQPKALKVIDPVMGDDGVLYRGMVPEMPAEMCRLCAEADIITPNMTEYALLTGEEYSLVPRTENQAKEMLSRLLETTRAHSALLTSVPMRNGLANVHMDQTGNFDLLHFERLPTHYPGTGDLYASVLTGALLNGKDLAGANRLATEYVKATIAYTDACGTEIPYGVQLEKTLHMLSRENG